MLLLGTHLRWGHPSPKTPQFSGSFAHKSPILNQEAIHSACKAAGAIPFFTTPQKHPVLLLLLQDCLYLLGPLSAGLHRAMTQHKWMSAPGHHLGDPNSARYGCATLPTTPTRRQRAGETLRGPRRILKKWAPHCPAPHPGLSIPGSPQPVTI